MRLKVAFFLALPHLAFADANSCSAINPNENPAESISTCSKLLATGELTTAERAEALENRGIAFREVGEYSKSIEDIGASLALAENTSTMRMLAWTYREVGRLTDAEQLYTRVLERDTHAQGWLSRCVVRQDMERYKQALADCQEALRQDEENLDSLYFTARAHSFLDQPEEALPLTITAMKLAPQDPRHLVENVWAMHQLGKTIDARRKALNGLDQFPDEPGLLSFLNETR
ncbi:MULTISPECIES: tetratricopeptide repeat protein [Mameliella]|uniref:Poly-beta-1,6 N-acetyl-D-glucosamine export porin PgaA n=1 Tax=Mameliella alba TaxID=561184 RepID=A0A0B3RTH3_9RHOB|nr:MULTISPECIES: tetratricopeptide repeat protein [Mameliella]KHQ54280.1 poly-beta-1,6 N-acetyl-D-glucosamine export porin PgaA [Mameliella alba]MDD9732661.1 tetratricopeptide repeat protein [Mameliella sp. AT18]